MAARDADAVGNQARQVRGAHPDGDRHDEDSWRSAQIMAGRQRCSDGPTDVVAFAKPMVDSRVRGSNLLILSLPLRRLPPYFNWSGVVKSLTTPGAVARVSHRLRGRRATFREETLPFVDKADEVRDEGDPHEFDRSRFEGTELASGTAGLSPVFAGGLRSG